LSPEHQQIWLAKSSQGDFTLHPDYYRTSIVGDWGERISIFDAFVAELKIVNEMCTLMGRPPLFRCDYEDKPDGFEFLLRPTSKDLHGFCLLLDKMMSENINKSFFRHDVPLEFEQERADGKIVVSQKGTIAIFETWLRKYFRTSEREVIDEIFSAFREVRKLRQSPAHKIDNNLFDQQFFKKQREIMKRAYVAVRNIRLAFANHPAVRAQPLEIFPELRDGKIWTL
jgi:hypothetical protein